MELLIHGTSKINQFVVQESHVVQVTLQLVILFSQMLNSI